MRAFGGERGSMSVFVVIFSIAVFLLAGLLVDGGAAINARLKAADVAEQGARAAADQIDVETLRSTGQVRLSADDRESLSAMTQFHVRSVKARRDIIREGERPDSVNLILEFRLLRFQTGLRDSLSAYRDTCCEVVSTSVRARDAAGSTPPGACALLRRVERQVQLPHRPDGAVCWRR